MVDTNRLLNKLVKISRIDSIRLNKSYCLPVRYVLVRIHNCVHPLRYAQSLNGSSHVIYYEGKDEDFSDWLVNFVVNKNCMVFYNTCLGRQVFIPKASSLKELQIYVDLYDMDLRF